jgi:hypothetical protein
MTESAAAAFAYEQESLNAILEKNGQITDRDRKAVSYMANEMREAGDATQVATDAFQRQVTVADTIRNGLDNIAEAGLHGFKDLKSAAASFAEELALLIVKLYAIQPLLDSLFGKQGTALSGSGGNFLTSLFGSGGILSSIFGTSNNYGPLSYTGVGVTPSVFGTYADGGVLPPNKWGLVGERGPELAYGGATGLTIAPLTSPKVDGRGGSSLVISIDARGAQMGVAEQIEASMRKWAPRLISGAVQVSDQRFTSNYDRTIRDKR